MKPHELFLSIMKILSVIVTRSAWRSPFAILYAVNVGKMKASDMKDRIYHTIGRPCSTNERNSKCILYETMGGGSEEKRLHCQ